MWSTALLAQDRIPVSGTVRDSVGNPLSGISVSVKGTKTGTTTDVLGNFKIAAGREESLVFSGIGYLSQTVPVSSSAFNLVMRSDPKNLSEVVVTGFGQRKDIRKVAYSVTEIKGDEITRANNANFVAALQGKVAGVYVGQGAGGPSSSAKIRIRGNNSLRPNTQPLIVIDGILIQPGNTGADSWGSNKDFGNIVKDLNPDDYESVDVLKGSAATSLYGSIAQNGVLLITTKKGRARKDLGITLTHTESFDKAYKLPDYQNVYGGGIKPTFDKDGSGNDIVDPVYANIYLTPGEAGYSYGPKFDGHMVLDLDGKMRPWVANDPLKFFITGKYINTNLAIEGGNESSTYRFSWSNLANNSVMPNNRMDRNSFALKATHKIGKIFNLQASVNYTMSRIRNPILQGGTYSPLFAFTYLMPRNAPIMDYRNNYIDSARGGYKTGPSKDPYYLAHTMFHLFEENSIRKESNLLADLDLTINIAPGLTGLVRTNVTNYNDNTEDKYLGTGAGFSGGSYSLTQSSYRNIRVQGLLTYTKDFGQDFSLNASAGGETVRDLGGFSEQVSTNGGLVVPGLYNIGNSVSSANVSVNNSNWPYATKRIDAVYAYGDLTWQNMLTVNASLRNDWTSTLAYQDGHGKITALYPSFGLSWVFTELPMFKESNKSILSFGKLRASLGWSGAYPDAYYTNTIGFYRQNGTFNNSGNANQPLYTFDGSTLGNKDLKAERTRELEFGADIRFFDNRLGFDVAWYKKNSFNQILELAAPPESGVTSRAVNAGNIQNQGIEILMTATPVKTRDFQWNATVNFTRNRNKIIALVPGTTTKQLELAFGADASANAVVGKDYGTVLSNYAFATYSGKNAAVQGKRVVGNVNGATGDYYTYMRSGNYDGTTKTLGNIMERWMGSTTQEFRYKDISVSVQIDAKIGGVMASASHQYGSESGNFKNSLPGRNASLGGVTYTDASGSHDDGIIPDAVFADGTMVGATDLGGMTYADAVKANLVKPIPAYAYYENLSKWSTGIREYSIFENSWVAVREVTVGYNLPASIYKKIKFSSLRVSVTGRNLGYLHKTAKDGINPEGFYNNNSAGFAEYGGLPYIRSLGFSVKAGF